MSISPLTPTSEDSSPYFGFFFSLTLFVVALLALSRIPPKRIYKATKKDLSELTDRLKKWATPFSTSHTSIANQTREHIEDLFNGDYRGNPAKRNLQVHYLRDRQGQIQAVMLSQPLQMDWNWVGWDGVSKPKTKPQWIGKAKKPRWQIDFLISSPQRSYPFAGAVLIAHAVFLSQKSRFSMVEAVSIPDSRPYFSRLGFLDTEHGFVLRGESMKQLYHEYQKHFF